MKLIVTFIASLFLAAPSAAPRFDLIVRADFFAGFAGSAERLARGMAACERVLELQAPIFATLGDHPKGELLFGLAEGFSRLGNVEKARTCFDRLIADAPASGQAPKAKTWLATGAIPKSEGLGCVGCHK
jgi:hypothetical protein